MLRVTRALSPLVAFSASSRVSQQVLRSALPRSATRARGLATDAAGLSKRFELDEIPDEEAAKLDADAEAERELLQEEREDDGRSLPDFAAVLSMPGSPFTPDMINEALARSGRNSTSSFIKNRTADDIAKGFERFLDSMSIDPKLSLMAGFGKLQQLAADVARSTELEIFLPILARRMQAYEGKQFAGNEIASALYLLHNVDAKSPEVRLLLAGLAHHAAGNPRAYWDGMEVGNALFGLQRMSSDVPEAVAVIEALTPFIATAQHFLDGREVAHALFGLQNMSSEVPAVRKLVGLLATRVKNANPLGAQNVGTALAGLKNMKADSEEVKTLVRHLTVHVAAAESRQFTPEALTNCLIGTRLMDAASDEVKALISAISIHVASCELPFYAGDAAAALASFNGKSSESTEVRAALAALLPVVKNARGAFRAADVASCLHGLANMSAQQAEVKALVGALQPHVAVYSGAAAADKAAALGDSVPALVESLLALDGATQIAVPEANIDLHTPALGGKMENMTTEERFRMLMSAADDTLKNLVGRKEFEEAARRFANQPFGGEAPPRHNPLPGVPYIPATAIPNQPTASPPSSHDTRNFSFD